MLQKPSLSLMQEGHEAPLLRAAGGHLQWPVSVLALLLVLALDVLQLVPVQERVLAERQRHSESGAAQPKQLPVAVQVLAQAQV
jgi:hypothetical protein